MRGEVAIEDDSDGDVQQVYHGAQRSAPSSLHYQGRKGDGGAVNAVAYRSMWEQRLVLLMGPPNQDREILERFIRQGWVVAAVVPYRDGTREAFLLRWVERSQPPYGESDDPT